MVYAGHHIIDRYLGHEHAERIADEAAQNSNKFL
jgi:hypothetical protein